MINSNEMFNLSKKYRTFFMPERQLIEDHNGSPNVYDFFIISEIFIHDKNEEKIEAQIKKSMEEWINGLHAFNTKLIFKVSSDGNGRIEVSIADTKRKLKQSNVENSFPSTMVNASSESITTYNHTAAVVGIPSTKEEDTSAWLTLFLRGNAYRRFTICILAQPVENYHLLESLEEDYVYWQGKQKKTFSESITKNEQTQKGETSGGNKGAVVVGVNSSKNWSNATGESTTYDTSTEESSFLIEQYCLLLEKHMERFHFASSIGLWQTAIYVSAEEPSVLKEVQMALNGAASKEEHLMGFHLFESKKVADYMSTASFPSDVEEKNLLRGNHHPATSVLNSHELAKLSYLPSEKYEGFSLRTVKDFEIETGFEAIDEEAWEIGFNFQRNKLINKSMKLPFSKLRQHTLVGGITGSGKTNTVLSLLQSSQVPYLIIEPSKQEYRHLTSLMEDVQVYTVGNELVSPLRLNPFYFPPGISVMAHIDSLKAVFMSAFSMYASMPNILEQCLYAVYQKAGWDLSTSINIYVDTNISLECYPTLGQLYEEIDEYLKNSGYAEEQESNIRAALLTRLKSLMTGSKGKLLNTVNTFNFQRLLKQKTIIELEEIADEDDKALVMGIFFIRLSEELKITLGENIDGSLRHFTVVEEAHRLFKNHQGNNNAEIADIKGKAVEYFCNLLSEIRSLGEGMIIVDQVPTKLAPDALKNTDTKIIHRLASQDDAEYVAQSLVLQQEDTRFLSQLKRGEILFYTSGMHGPSHIKVHSAKEKMVYTTSMDLRKNAEEYNSILRDKEIAHPIAENIIYQDERLKQQIIIIYEKFYFNAIYGEITLINEVLAEMSTKVINAVKKFGYEIPETQKNSFLACILSKITDVYVNSVLYYSKLKTFSKSIAHYLKLLVENHVYRWSEKELVLMKKQRDTLIYSNLRAINERLLVEEASVHWMEKKRTETDGEAVRIASSLLQENIYQVIDKNASATENAEKTYLYALTHIKNKFLIWQPTNQTEELTWRVLKQITVYAKNENLWELFSIWISKERVYGNH
ncbi:ATP-binding protein [Marinococcus luteus]|uniref:ATP-binding protein n=1 Tax=Marinococcus luteus TaxID=1122204 RepID=UPI002ACCB7FF|nr:DUF87 domain-containing protein [Marinococcus luteus]MDZ5783373.1 DUF87 domain-containing protein [Marinococcus luteus]